MTTSTRISTRSAAGLSGISLSHRFGSFVLLASSLLGTSFSVGCKRPAAEEEKPETVVQAEHPELGTLSEEISADAVLSPVAQAAILPKITAPIRSFYVQRGSRVKAGQLVAVLENRDLAAAAADNAGAYQAAQGAYQIAVGTTVTDEQIKARTDLEQAKSTLDLDNAIVSSRQQLYTQGAIPGRDLDTAKATAVQAQSAYEIALNHYNAIQKTGTTASLEAAKGTLASAKGKLAGAEAQLSYTQIRTPISGVVTDRPLFPGETPAAGSPIVTIMDTSSVLAKLHIAQVQAQQLKLGSPASLIIPGMDEPVDAKVFLISPALDPGSTTVEVWLKAANPAGRLKAGTAVHVQMKGGTVTNVMTVPTEAIQRSTEGEGKVVLVIADGKVKKRPVVTGISTKESTQVISGLQADDTVITGGGYGLDDGAAVKIGPPEKKDEADAADEKGAAADKAAADEKDAADKKAPAAKPAAGKAKAADAKEGGK